MSQTSVNNSPAQAYPGMLAVGVQFPTTIESMLASGEIPFGKAVSLYDDSEVELGNQRVKLPASGSEGPAVKACSAETYNLADGDTMVIDVDNVGAATVTFNAAAGSVTDTTTYTGGTAGSVTDTTSYPCADQTGLTEKFTIDGGSEQTVTFGTATTALLIAEDINDQLSGASASVVGGQVVVTSDRVGVDSSVAIGTGTCALTWAAAVAGTGGLADQDGLTEKFTVDGGTEQTVTFSGAACATGKVTEAVDIASQINDQLLGASAVVTAGQVVVTSDSKGTGSSIAIGTGTCALTWAAAAAGTGDAVDASAVTAAEIETLIEGDCTAEVTVSSGVPTIKSPTIGDGTELDFQSGTLLAKLGLSVEVITEPAAGDLYKGNFRGIAIADVSMEAYTTYGAYADKDSVSVLRKGRVWVVSADTVDDISKGVYVRYQNGAAAPGHTNGSFRATANADYELMTQLEWIAGATIGGVYYGLVEINLV